jgi:hypothetical protein
MSAQSNGRGLIQGHPIAKHAMIIINPANRGTNPAEIRFRLSVMSQMLAARIAVPSNWSTMLPQTLIPFIRAKINIQQNLWANNTWRG